MGTITLSVPKELKDKMDKIDWINWSSIARHAFFDTLKDVKELELRKKAVEISEIPDDDTREVKESVAKQAVESIEKAANELRSGKRKPKSIAEFNKWCDEA
jgi:hypothetical protein